MKLNFKHIFVFFAVFNLFSSFAQTKAVSIIQKSLSMESVEDSLEYLLAQAESVEQNCDRRVLFAFSGCVQEQDSLYEDASSSFAKAAAISVSQEVVNAFVLKKEASPAEKIVYSMLKKTSSILVLDAVRCSLNCGNYKNALSYLNSSVRNSKDEKIQAKIKLYEIWAKLCQAEDEQSLAEPIALLKAYSSLDSMKSVMPSLLFTLWYIDNDLQSAEILKSKYPASPEANIVLGTANFMPSPFWYFVPRKGNVIASINDKKAKTSIVDSTQSENKNAKNNATASSSENEKVKRQQVGLFGKKENAQAMVSRLKEKGFAAYIEEEKRPSGNIYFLVIVDENEKGNMSIQLKTAGFDSYPIFN